MREIIILRHHVTLASVLDSAENEFQYDWKNLPYHRLCYSSTYQHDNASHPLYIHISRVDSNQTAIIMSYEIRQKKLCLHPLQSSTWLATRGSSQFSNVQHTNSCQVSHFGFLGYGRPNRKDNDHRCLSRNFWMASGIFIFGSFSIELSMLLGSNNVSSDSGLDEGRHPPAPARSFQWLIQRKTELLGDAVNTRGETVVFSFTQVACTLAGVADWYRISLTACDIWIQIVNALYVLLLWRNIVVEIGIVWSSSRVRIQGIQQVVASRVSYRALLVNW